MNDTGSLSDQSCQSCHDGMKALSDTDWRRYLAQVPGWEVREGKLERPYGLKNFKEALALVNRIGELAEKENHHPDLLIHDYRYVKVSLWTHVASGLTVNDFILAAKINELL